MLDRLVARGAVPLLVLMAFAGCFEPSQAEDADRVAAPAPALPRSHGPDAEPVRTSLEDMETGRYGLEWSPYSSMVAWFGMPFRMAVEPVPATGVRPSDTVVWTVVDADGQLLERTVGWAYQDLAPPREARFIQVAAYDEEGVAIAARTRALPANTFHSVSFPCADLPDTTGACPAASVTLPRGIEQFLVDGGVGTTLDDPTRTPKMEVRDGSGRLVADDTMNTGFMEPRGLSITTFGPFDVERPWTLTWQDETRAGGHAWYSWHMAISTQGLPTPTFPVVDLAQLPPRPEMGVRLEIPFAMHADVGSGTNIRLQTDPVGAPAPEGIELGLEVYDHDGTRVARLDPEEGLEFFGAEWRTDTYGLFWAHASAHRAGVLVAEDAHPILVGVFRPVESNATCAPTAGLLSSPCAVAFDVPDGVASLTVGASWEGPGVATLVDNHGAARGERFAPGDFVVDPKPEDVGTWHIRFTPPFGGGTVELAIRDVQTSYRGQPPPAFHG